MAAVSAHDFVQLFETHGPHETARRLGHSAQAVFQRRTRLEQQLQRQIRAPDQTGRVTRRAKDHPGRLSYTLSDGVVLVGSDAHYWPGIESTAHRAFVRFCREIKPAAVIANGDMLDGASISRHPPICWEERPSVIDELEAVKDRLGEITKAAGKARRFWPLGNHDGRFETRLATVAPEYARVHGFHLQDHIPDFEPCWSVLINGDVLVKHRFKGGVHAAYNNSLHSGVSIVTGHLHRGTVTPFTDERGTRYGVDLPTMADPNGDQFEYQEDNTRNQRSGFAVLTFVRGRLMQPEMALVWDADHIEFRGQVIRV